MTKWNFKENFSKIKGLSTIGFGSIFSSLIFGVFWFYLASIIGTENYGNISYFVSIVILAASVSAIGIGNTLLVFAGKEPKILPGLYFITLFTSLIAAIVVFFIFYKFEVSAYIIGLVLFHLSIETLLGQKLYKKYARLLIIQAILFATLSLSLYYVMGENGVLLGFALSFIPSFLHVIQNFKLKPDFSLLRKNFFFILNNHALSLAKALGLTLDKIIIFPLLGSVLLGNYFLGFQFLTILSIFPSIVAKYVVPREAIGQSNEKLTKITILLSIALTISGFFLAPKILPLILPGFESAVEILPIMSLAIIPRAINVRFNSKLLAAEKNKFMVFGAIIFLSVQIPLILVLSDIYGLVGAAISLVLAHTFETIFLGFATHHINRKQF